ncbi:MAG: long-chain-fatty-acid--CoA ligase [Pseudomonadales bacterium]
MVLHDYLEFHARDTPDKVYVQFDGAIVTYDEANRRANRIAHSLTGAGLSKGDRFAYLSKNSIDFALMYFGASKVGAVPVPLNYRLAPREWEYIVNDARCRLLVAEHEFVTGIDRVRGALSAEQFVAIGEQNHDGWTSHEDWLSDDETNPNVAVEASDQIYQMYTSGTTGLPKGAMLSQYAIDNNIRQISTALSASEAERCLVVAPMYHAAAGICLMTMGVLGCTIVVHREFDPAAVVRSLSEDAISVATLVPAMIQACLTGVPDVRARRYDSLNVLFYGASPIAQETLREAMDTFRCDFVQGFGMTETTALATSLSREDHRRALAGEPGLLLSAGRAAIGTQIRIIDGEGNEVPRGTIGEVAVRGPQLMTGYWNLPEASAKSLVNGWMHTGDAAYMDEEGFIYIQDRIKDMVVSGGENIYPSEIESVLFEHPAVADAAVIGVPSERWGEEVLAFLQLKPGEWIQPETVIDFCRDRLAGYKIPRRIEVIDQIPRNASGKVLKKDLREPYWRGIERRVG